MPPPPMEPPKEAELLYTSTSLSWCANTCIPLLTLSTFATPAMVSLSRFSTEIAPAILPLPYIPAATLTPVAVVSTSCLFKAFTFNLSALTSNLSTPAAVSLTLPTTCA